MANFFIRITDIVAANINDMLDRVEDPERIIRQIIREMEDNIRRAREGVLDAIANEKQLARELDHHRRQSDEWRERAAKAIRTGKEDLAKKALARKKEHDAIAENLANAWDAAANTSHNLKTQLRQLENKLNEARRKRSSLASRQRAAEARQQMSVATRCFKTGLDTRDRFDRMEARVVEIETRSEAIIELNDDRSDLEKEFDELVLETDVDLEFEALKKEIDADAD